MSTLVMYKTGWARQAFITVSIAVHERDGACRVPD
jgi:hypothetical protein